MFERYTEKARRVIFFARYEASVFGSPYIEIEHFLLGLMREDRALFARLVPKSSDVTALSEGVRAGIQTGPRVSTSVDIPLSQTTKRVLAYGAEEAERLRHNQIGTAHLLLGVLREESSVSALLRKFGFDLERVRQDLADSKPNAGQAAISSAAIVRELQNQFEKIAKRLTSDVEPAVVFRFNHPGQAGSE